MIVKYQNDEVWGYIDDVRQAACKQINCDKLIEEYDKTLLLAANDPAEYINGKRLDENVIKSNKVFTAAWDSIAEDSGNRHAENILNSDMMDFPSVTILIYLEDCKEYDSVLLITNQKAYLMNDKGQTIERLN